MDVLKISEQLDLVEQQLEWWCKQDPFVNELFSRTFLQQCKRQKMLNETKPMAFHGEAPQMLGWNLEADELSLLHPHWQTFEAPPFYYHLLLAIMYFFLMCASTLGNGVVIWIFSS